MDIKKSCWINKVVTNICVCC